MLKFEIKQNEHAIKMKLNKRLSKKIQIAGKVLMELQ